MKVPFADLHLQYLSLKEEIDAAIASVIRSSAFIRGPFVQTFEDEFSASVGAPYCISCANGTDSLFIAMRALGVRPGDEVITTAHSWISTTETISQAGGNVVFCDTDALTHTIDPVQIEAKITARTVGIIPVHLYGQPADMTAIMAIARKHGLWVIEDCAQSHLAEIDGQIVGSFGDVASYSFYPGKNLGAMGDAGAITCKDKSLADRMAMFARHGGLSKGEHQIEGINSRLDGLQAAILSVKLPRLREWTAKRQELARRYVSALKDISWVELPETAAGRSHVYHLFVIKHERRDVLAAHLNRAGIQTVINYPISLPFLPAYARLGHRPEDFPNAFGNQSKILSIPIFPEMSEAQLLYVADTIRGFAG
ncbi:DegT/DnrJ/EryC1/StrS family aminotransferase [Rhizobium laguerreae]|uniref:DegT/DnrJ/EryC1/StrS family aminotransferase n=1 Tax=Rhizobium laguerreae TaxID=1076926 RepID=UPI001C9228E5|nr:DegT/DnrJ/EryC1/StrS family aminotransferase [Rhizobium laguerreae]MBY3311219.1 DegT/DnrJ/EryC1/StrS family aminotransferase [Rhizobium laguerreae]